MIAKATKAVVNLGDIRKKVVGEPDEGKPHEWFEAAGDGNQDSAIFGAIP